MGTDISVSPLFHGVAKEQLELMIIQVIIISTLIPISFMYF